MERRIVGFHQDEEQHWVAELECGHNQHVRHDPPWTERDWVTTTEGRQAHLGGVLDCKKCDRAEPLDRAPKPERKLSLFDRDVGRLLAIVAFAAACCAIFGLMYGLTLATQMIHSPSFLAIPLIGAFIALFPAIAGFTVGAPFLGRRYALWRCIALAFFPIIAGAALAYPIGNLSPVSMGDAVLNSAVALMFIVCACLPLLARKRREP